MVTVTIYTLLLATAHAAPVGPNLYIAGDGFTIEQALGDAQADGAKQYKVLVTGSEAPRLVAARATRDTLDALKQARASHGRVFVCAKDLVRLGITPHELVRGVGAVRGYASDEKAPAWERRLPRAPDRKSAAVCAED